MNKTTPLQGSMLLFQRKCFSFVENLSSNCMEWGICATELAGPWGQARRSPSRCAFAMTIACPCAAQLHRLVMGMVVTGGGVERSRDKQFFHCPPRAWVSASLVRAGWRPPAKLSKLIYDEGCWFSSRCSLRALQWNRRSEWGWPGDKGHRLDRYCPYEEEKSGHDFQYLY